MDTFAHISVATTARRAILNHTIAALPALFGGRGVSQLILDPGAIARLRAAARMVRTQQRQEPPAR
jgi:hypothetical protein